MNKIESINYFNKVALERDKWKNRNRYYHQDIEKLFNFLVPENSSVLEIGCGTGDILSRLKSEKKKGIDISPEMISVAKNKYPGLNFDTGDAENLSLNEKYDYIILSGIVGSLLDIQKTFQELHKVSYSKSRIIITYYNYLWEPILKLAEKLHLKMPQPWQNWVSSPDLENFFNLSGFEVIKKGNRLLLPKYIPIISTIFNRYLAKFPIIKELCLTYYMVVRPYPKPSDSEPVVSIIVPARNEAGNLEPLIRRIPSLGSHTEIIFIEGHSKDNTLEEAQRIKNKYSDKDIKVFVQDGSGKGDAVRKGFDIAKGDVLMILDADLSVFPEDVSKFYEALIMERGELINGCRLVYPLEKESMRFLNLLGNKFFSMMFSWLLDQKVKDTLCGTKALWKKDYQKIKAGRKFFGDFDPFGDFDLLFGAAKLNFKIIDLPIRYQPRTYGSTNISRFRHGWLLLEMCFFAMRKIKFI